VSHYKDLRYRGYRGYSYNWYTHEARADYPYETEESSDYEFKAWRG